MPMFHKGRHAIALTLWILMADAAAAQAVLRDEATGLNVWAPDGYVVQRAENPPTVHAGARFSVRRPADPPSAGCMVEAQRLPDDPSSGLARVLLSRREGEKMSWRDKALQQIMSSLSVQSSRSYSEGGAEALQVEGWPRQEAGSQEARIDRSARVRIVLLKADHGYVNVTCRAEAAAFPTRSAEFAQVARGVKLTR